MSAITSDRKDSQRARRVANNFSVRQKYLGLFVPWTIPTIDRLRTVHGTNSPWTSPSLCDPRSQLTERISYRRQASEPLSERSSGFSRPWTSYINAVQFSRRNYLYKRVGNVVYCPYTPPTPRRLNCRVASRRRRRCEQNLQLAHNVCRWIQSTIWKVTKQTPWRFDYVEKFSTMASLWRHLSLTSIAQQHRKL